jgi:hypothetical protein
VVSTAVPATLAVVETTVPATEAVVDTTVPATESTVQEQQARDKAHTDIVLRKA